MKYKLFRTIFTTLYIIGTVVAQNEDELQIPVETDNQFPPDNTDADGLIEGSGGGVVDEPKIYSSTDSTPSFILHNGGVSNIPIEGEHTDTTVSDTTLLPCPKPCVCNTEGTTHNYVVDCSGYNLKEFPSPIDPRTTTLKLHNNQITEIPKEVSNLKKLKILNANNNSIMDLELGSVSELPELVTLKLGNNRLIEYPKDLKNSLSLTKLEELDLGGNDMRTGLSKDSFSNMKALRRLTLPSGSSELMLDLCGSLKETLETICENTCGTKSFDCPDAPPEDFGENLFDATLPGMISFSSSVVENRQGLEKPDISVTGEAPLTTSTTISPKLLTRPKENIPVDEYSLRTPVDKAPKGEILNNVAETPKEVTTDTNVKVGAKTMDENSGGGGVSKSVIGIVVVGMVVIVAVITIKKNWGSIKKKFSSSPNRAVNERSGANLNGTTPEEIPLQDKTEKLPV